MSFFYFQSKVFNEQSGHLLFQLIGLFCSWQGQRLFHKRAVKESDEIEIEIAYIFIKAAKFHGQVFWKQYQNSTWLADGTTLISDWHDTFDAPLNRCVA